jgi:hypothetical protein
MGNSPSSEAVAGQEPGNTLTQPASQTDLRGDIAYQEIVTEQPAGAAGRNVIVVVV